MLIEKPIKKGEVVSVRLITGEEVIATLEEQTDAGLKLSKPMTVSMNQQGYGLMPFMLTVDPDQSHFIQQSHVMSIVKTNEGTEKAYIKSTTNLIV
jgi:hypothetical protein